MTETQFFVRYFLFTNTIRFTSKIGAHVLGDFAAAISLWLKQKPSEPAILDFSAVEKAYSNGMLAIIATLMDLREKGFAYKVVLPVDDQVRKMFRSNNWAHFLDSQQAPSESRHSRHLVTRQFTSFDELPEIITDFMDVVLRTASMPKDIISALEWSVNEICDNVINHSEAATGGLVQVTTYPLLQQIAFTVADAGKGILHSLREGIPTLRTDAQAIGEAIKAGVTRNKEFGQGNGLAGTVRITALTGGSIDISTGCARFFSSPAKDRTIEGRKMQYFSGTSVSGLIKINKDFSIRQALSFNGINYDVLNVIDLSYEMEDKDCLLIEMKKETTGVGTRGAGKQMKTKVMNLIFAKPDYPIYIDWQGIPIISSSFADEFIGKLFLELGPIGFAAKIRNKGLEPVVHQLLDKAIVQRVSQAEASGGE